MLDSAPPIKKLRLRSAGMFSNVNEVVEQIRLAQSGKYRFVIDWSESCYRDPDKSGDPWRYYFEPCYPDLSDQSDEVHALPELARGVPVACSRDNIITPRLEEGNCNPLLLPRDRVGAHQIVSNYIRLNRQTQAHVDMSAQRAFDRPVIGLHIRGPGRTDGGVPGLRRKFVNDDSVPMEPFLSAVAARLERTPEALIFACSDSAQVIATLMTEFGDRLITSDASRSDFGEMHARHPKNKGLEFAPYKLGLDVITDAYLLARTDFLVHGNSNVSNFILCLNPGLEHQYVPA